MELGHVPSKGYSVNVDKELDSAEEEGTKNGSLKSSQVSSSCNGQGCQVRVGTGGEGERWTASSGARHCNSFHLTHNLVQCPSLTCLLTTSLTHAPNTPQKHPTHLIPPHSTITSPFYTPHQLIRHSAHTQFTPPTPQPTLLSPPLPIHPSISL